MNAEHIENIFGDYLIENETQYALLLNSPWGSGKTYFWKQKLQPIVLRNSLKPIYISLNGVAKIETIEYQIMLGMMPFISQKETGRLRSVFKLISNGFDTVLTSLTGSKFSDFVNGIVANNLNFTDKLICFDDLERCQIPIGEVLGFINNFIEHKQAKVLFLADESRFNDIEYQKVKEKIIRYTLNFEPSLPELIPQLLLKYKNDNHDFYQYLHTEKELFIKTLQLVNETNLRNISFIMDCLQKLFPVFSNEKGDIQKEIIFFSTIISIEYKAGNLKSTDYKDRKKLDRLNKSYERSRISKVALDQKKKREEIEPHIEKPYEEVFYLKFLTGRIDYYYFYPSIYSLILSGYFNAERFKNEIEGRKKIVVTQEQKDLQKIMEGKYKWLEQKEFDRLTSTVWENALLGNYSIYDYPHILNHYHHFSLNNLITETVENVKAGLKKGLEIAILRKELDDNQLNNLMAFISPEHIEEFKKLVQDYHYKTQEQNYLGLGVQLIGALNQNDQHRLKMVGDQIVNTIYPFFNSVDQNLLFDAILKTNNAMLCDLSSILPHRYHRTDIHKSLHSEVESFEILGTKLKSYLKEEKHLEPLRHHLLLILLNEIGEVLNALENKMMGTPR
ncbi:KAP family NTPase [Flavobacterium cerinum]|uniref:KAP family NTPase n=1 Tax=Flavobacterium cerinum TaxID=2502784 RepID=A0ABY5IPG3_9FLAO|nr:KAP family NTPase [Flavobacterium cerinum]UUC44171.1 KAP family NTPase [Flavobacterium cerinum]